MSWTSNSTFRSSRNRTGGVARMTGLERRIGLWHNGVRLCDAEVAETHAQRRVGLLGRTGVVGVFVLEPCRSVHSFRMKFALDVAGCSRTRDGSLLVRWIKRLPRNRLFLLSLGANVMVEAETGTFTGYGIKRADQLELR